MTVCAAFGCSNRSSHKSENQLEREKYLGRSITFHTFPKHQEKKDQWIKALKRESWTPTEYSRLCEDHFTFGCMDRSMSYVWLHENAIPTIFPAFPSYMQQETRKRKSPMKRNPSSGVHSAESDGLLTNVVPFTTDSETTDSFNKKRNLDHSTKEGVVKKLKTTTVKYKKKIKSLQQTKRRQVKKIVSLKSVLALLRESKLINGECIETLKSIPGPNKDLFERLLKKQINESLPKKYNEELRSFALTLHYYSPPAYSYVRRVFNSCLPHPKTITSWYKAVNGEPGFTQEAFQALAARAKQCDQKLVCAMMLDEMAIRKHIEYDGKQFLGGVDMGTGLEGDNISMAKEALVFVIVCINAGWKIPVGYFLVDGVNGEQRANLVKQCLTMAHETGVRVVSLTFDGAPANFSMVRYLGCIINSYQELQTSFNHPTSGEKVYIFPDPCHMLKLVRNTLGQKKKIIDGDNNVIVWEFIEKLQKLQDFEGLHLANKLKLSHINFTKQIMKVHLAAQLFSDSIADALEICLKNLKLPDFKDCQPTIYFIRLMNKLFDIFNSKSLNHYAFKKAINPLNSEVILSFIGEAKLYIRRLKFSINGDLIIDSNRKTGFVGFLLCIESLERMYTELCVEKCLLLYVPMYKISQDHLELLFSTIRAQGGCNNNPSVRQFKSAYKKILIHTELRETSKGNCIPLEEISILHCSSSTPTCAVTIINQSTGRMRLAEEPESQNIIADHNYAPDVREITRYSEYIISYIAGFVVRKLQNKVKCEDCVVAFSSTNGDCETLSLINVKNRGGLIYPSTDVIRVCQRSEYVVKSAIAQSGGQLLLRKFSADFLTHKVLQYFLGKNIFKCLTRHSFEHSPLENHSVHLIRAIANCYITLRIHYIAKCSIDKSKNVRNLYNKLVLFKGH